MSESLEPALYLVPVPIGNLEDITLRALSTLKRADAIACEDTRTTGQLLKLLGIQAKKLLSYHDHNEAERAGDLIRAIANGAAIALVSDAGSPGISDPGFRIVRLATESGISVTALPGATALIPALTASGLPSSEFSFLGFPPHKKGRQTFLKNALAEEKTVILYESSHRIVKLLEEICTLGGKERPVCVCREITKKFEEFTRGNAEECWKILSARNAQKGEFVLVLGTKEKS